MKYLTTSLLTAICLPCNAAIVIYNQNNPMDDTDLPSGGWGNYLGFSVSFNDAALTTDFTAPDSAPLPSTIFLTDLTIRRSGTTGTGAAGDPQNALLKIYTSQTPSSASWVGDSLGTQDMRQGISDANIAYTFDTLELSSASTYWFYFANTAGDGSETPITWATGRLRVSNNANITYSSGNLVNPSFGNQDTAFDPVFVATFSSIPEPNITILGSLGLLTLLRRRR